MDDISGRACVFEKGRERPVPSASTDSRAAGLMPLGAGLSLREQALLQPPDELRVLAVRGDDDAELLRQAERLIHLAIVDAEEVLVGEEDLEGADAIADDLAQLRFGLVVELRDRHVEGVVARARPSAFDFQS